jgi:hypothetical protein
MDLYTRDLGDLTFRRLCGGNNNEDGEGESCVEIAPIPGVRTSSPCVTARTRMPGRSGSPVPSCAPPG